MNAGVTFERVYHALKEQVTGGRLQPGAHLEPALLSHQLNASITPVRDALHRLAGEGLVHTPRGEGFRVPQVTEVALRNLYRWNAALLDLAVRTRSDVAPAMPPDPSAGPLELTEQLFAALAGAAPNPEHVAAIIRLNERLRPIRIAELALIEGIDRELADLAEHVRGAAPPLRRALSAYHRRRERTVDRLVAELLAAR